MATQGGENKSLEDEEKQRAGTSQLSFMSSGCVSGPFVVLFSIPQQTTMGHMKHSSTKSQERAGVCVCVCVCVCACVRVCVCWMVRVVPSLHPTALPLSTAWMYVYSLPFSFYSFLVIHFHSAAHSTTFTGRSQQSHRSVGF